MNSPLTFLCAFSLAITAPCVAKPHSWYPRECCSNHDCMPADDVERDTQGITVVTVGHRRIWVPRGFAARLSPDNRIHICFVVSPEEGIPAVLVCLFLPAHS
jgi:hypothetical protein